MIMVLFLNFNPGFLDLFLLGQEECKGLRKTKGRILNERIDKKNEEKINERTKEFKDG